MATERTINPPRTVLAEGTWSHLAAEHAQRVAEWTTPHLERRKRGIAHPVLDFMFDYYPFSPGKLESWHPGYGVTLTGDVGHYLASPAYERTPDGGATATLDWLNTSRRARLAMTIRILEGTASRPARTGCFGLHEWAMVYGLEQDQIRHEKVPLRISPSAIRATVDDIGLRCTHIDAYRFFTAEAEPMNATVPTRSTQADDDQPGCLHTSMDLYKFAFWHSPLVSSDLVFDCFVNAAHTREIDMRASPYDVTPFGLEPIRVETPEGRRRYVDEQHRMMERTDPLRKRLLDTLTKLSAL